MTTKIKYTFENWEILRKTVNPFQAPELARRCICGDCIEEGGKNMTLWEPTTINIGERFAISGEYHVTLKGDPSLEWATWLKENGFTIEQYQREAE